MLRGLMLAVGLLMLIPPLGFGQAPGPTTVALALHPAAEPVPALKHYLAPEIRDLTRGNAADCYYQALLLMGKEMPADQTEQMDRWATMPIKDLPKAEVRARLQNYPAALAELDRAAVCDHCDWGLTERLRRQGLATLLPELQRLRELSRLVRVRAHVEIAEGKFDDAVVSIRTGLMLGKNAAQGPTLINALVGIAIITTMLEQAEFLVSQPGAPNLYWALTALPSPVIDIPRAMQGERLFVEALFPHARGAARYNALSARELQTLQEKFLSLMGLLDGGGKADWKARLAFAAIAAKMYPEARKRLLASGAPAADLNTMPVVQVVLLDSMDEYERGLDDFLKWMSVPYWQADDGLRAAEAKLLAGRDKTFGPHSLALMLLPAVTKVHLASARTERRIAALRTLEAIRLHAATHANKFPDSLDAVTAVPLPVDPVTGKRFEFKRQGDKAELIGPPPGKEIAGPQNALRYELRFISSKE
jgi:hypothetical protein